MSILLKTFPLVWSLAHLHGQEYELVQPLMLSRAISGINSRWEQVWGELCLSSKPCFTMQMSPNPSSNTSPDKGGQSCLATQLFICLVDYSEYSSRQAETWVLPWLWCFWCPSELGERHPHTTLQPRFPLFQLSTWWLMPWPGAAQAVLDVLHWTPLVKRSVTAHFLCCLACAQSPAFTFTPPWFCTGFLQDASLPHSLSKLRGHLVSSVLDCSCRQGQKRQSKPSPASLFCQFHFTLWSRAEGSSVAMCQHFRLPELHILLSVYTWQPCESLSVAVFCHYYFFFVSKIIRLFWGNKCSKDLKLGFL